MPVTLNNTQVVFNDGTTQSTAAGVPSSITAIGSIIAAGNWSTSTLVAGNTIAGSSLLYATGGPPGGLVYGSFGVDVSGGMQGSRTGGNFGAYQPSNTTTLPGTWRVLSFSYARSVGFDPDYVGTTTIAYRGVLVQRIS